MFDDEFMNDMLLNSDLQGLEDEKDREEQEKDREEQETEDDEEQRFESI